MFSWHFSQVGSKQNAGDRHKPRWEDVSSLCKPAMPISTEDELGTHKSKNCPEHFYRAHQGEK